MTEITCTCGAVALSLSGPPILVAECHCTSCRTAADRLGVAIPEPNGGTRFVVQRKDRAVLQRGTEHLAAFRLTPQSGTQRIVATCCNSPIWLQFKGGHWLSLYAAQWPDGAAPRPDLRTITRDASDRLPDDLPNATTQSAGFMARLLWAWICMGFRNPPVADVRRVLDV